MSETSLAPGAFSSTVEEAMTYRQIELQNRDQESRMGNFQNAYRLQQGYDRARAIAVLIRDHEVQRQRLALQPMGERIRNNKDLAVPTKIIGAGAALWMGEAMTVVKNNSVRMDARIEARARSGGMSFSSTVINSVVEFRAGEGASITLNRELPFIASAVEFYYGSFDQSMRTALHHALIENLVLSIGANRFAESRESFAGLAYSVVL